MLETAKEMAEQANWKFTHEWYTGLDLNVEGVPLADAIEYDLLALLGRVYLAEGVAQDDKANPSN